MESPPSSSKSTFLSGQSLVFAFRGAVTEKSCLKIYNAEIIPFFSRKKPANCGFWNWTVFAEFAGKKRKTAKNEKYRENAPKAPNSLARKSEAHCSKRRFLRENPQKWNCSDSFAIFWKTAKKTRIFSKNRKDLDWTLDLRGGGG